MRHIAVIPARSGSKGLRDKNIKLLESKPLIAYTIEAAQQSGIFDCIHVSTDSQIYAEIGKEHGADVPFLRSEELSSDTASSWDAMRYVLEEYKDRGNNFNILTLLQPTSPLRTAEDIKSGYNIFLKEEAEAVIGVCEVDHSPLWSNILPDDGNMQGFINEAANGQRQKLPTYYRINGALYMLKTEFLMNQNMNLYGETTYAYIMPKERSIDIDDELDFIIAETIIARRSQP